MEAQTVKGPYKTRRIRRNPVPQLPRYFKTTLWKDLKERLEKANHICFIIVQNGEVNNVYIKTIEKEGQSLQRAVPTNPGPRDSDIAKEVGTNKAEEALHQNLHDSTLAPRKPHQAHSGEEPTESENRSPESQKDQKGNAVHDQPLPTADDRPGGFPQPRNRQDIPKADETRPGEEVPEEETTELPPEPAKIVQKPPPEAIPADSVPIQPSAAPEPAKPILPVMPKSPPADQSAQDPESGTEVKAGHRVKATYQNQEVKGTIERVLKEADRADEFVTILDSGNKVILYEKDLISILTTEK